MEFSPLYRQTGIRGEKPDWSQQAVAIFPDFRATDIVVLCGDSRAEAERRRPPGETKDAAIGPVFVGA